LDLQENNNQFLYNGKHIHNWKKSPGFGTHRNQQGGVKKTHYGRIEDIARDMFDGSDLYLVRVLDEVKTYKAESLLPLRKDTKRKQRR
jgi:hypothetical protein